MRSPAEVIAASPRAERDRVLANRDLAALQTEWKWWARPEQRGPEFRTAETLPSWAGELVLTPEQIARIRVWAYVAGRGAGKTRSGAEWLCDRAEAGYRNLALMGPTAGHNRTVMVEGESGVGVCAERRKLRMHYEPSKRRVTFQPRPGRHSKVTANIYSAEVPDDMAGENADSLWADELASWPTKTDASGRTAWDNAMLALRLSSLPQACVTTTPRAMPLIKELLGPEREVGAGGDVLVTRATVYDNPYLPAAFFEWITRRYAGTRLGQQELLGLMIEALGSFFRRDWFLDERADGHNRMLTPADWGAYMGAHDLPRVRYWDLAATEETGENDPDWTAGSRVALDAESHRLVWEDLVTVRASPGGVAKLVAEVAQGDPPGTVVYIEEDPAQAGKSQVAYYRDVVLGPLGIVCRGWKPSGPKATRATLPSTEAEAGRLWVVQHPQRPGEFAPWWKTAFDQLEEFTDDDSHGHDDIVDSLSGAVAVLLGATLEPVGDTSGAAVSGVRLGTVAPAAWGMPRLH